MSDINIKDIPEGAVVLQGTALSADFEENTFTFEIDGSFEVSAGEYMIVQTKIGNNE